MITEADRDPGQSARRGPYFVLQGFFHGQKFSERIPVEQAPQVQAQVANYRRFQSLDLDSKSEVTITFEAGDGERALFQIWAVAAP